MPNRDAIEPMRRVILCAFGGVTIDMDYLLCEPSIHARWRDQELTANFRGWIRTSTDGFPGELAELISRWAAAHEEEIIANHLRIGRSAWPLQPIAPPDPLEVQAVQPLLPPASD